MIKDCPICGKSFLCDGNKLYCSEECRMEARRRRERVSYHRKKELKRIENQRKKEIDSLSQKNGIARAQKMSYGELEAKKYLEALSKITV